MADVTLPQLGETVTEGTITQWFKKVGDTVAADEPLFEVSTDKVDTEVPSPIAGVVTEIRVAEGETVDVGTVIAVIGDQGAAPADAAPAAPAPEAAPAPAVEAEPAPEAAPAPAADGARARRRGARAGRRAAGPRPGGRRTAEPPPPAPAADAAAPAADAQPPRPRRRTVVVARRAASRERARHRSRPITGTGPGGRITREDVLDYIDANGSRAAASAPRRAAPAPAPGRRAARAEPAPAAPAAPAAAPARAGARAATRAPVSATRRSSCRRSVA